ncbi:hypothetical protein [Natronospira bacteriovora]|uniref:Uncharacterized protein n=1 Tax=Natronospira bacteriovora TaxID=3069753 RepID=A0ABU0W8G1_9GAMM|nr:hypothetical protein [Natronospira sp. AB-CW4]MDQ2069745.1 hypothetical protein [Natronospira sp. AB-CW4]
MKKMLCALFLSTMTMATAGAETLARLNFELHLGDELISAPSVAVIDGNASLTQGLEQEGLTILIGIQSVSQGEESVGMALNFRVEDLEGNVLMEQSSGEIRLDWQKRSEWDIPLGQGSAQSLTLAITPEAVSRNDL